MRRIHSWVLGLAVLIVLQGTTPTHAAPALTLTWLDMQQLAVTWTWPAETQQACGFIHRDAQTIFAGCIAPPAAPQLTLPPGSPPWDAAYRPLIGDRIEVRFYRSALIYESAEAVVTSGPPRIWLPITREK